MLQDQPQVGIKIGADFGGDSTKFYYQITNLDQTNSCFNTTIFCMFKSMESITNINIAMDLFRDQINSLGSESWRYDLTCRTRKIYLF